MHFCSRFRLTVFLALGSLLPAQLPTVDYAAEVAPLLQRHCGECHGERHQRSGLRLDLRAAILRGGRHGAAAVAGDSAHSLLIARITGAGDGKRMPLGEPPLPAADIATLRAWIDQGMAMPGADGPDDGVHWAYRPLQPPPRPPVAHAGWCRAELDYFVLADLEAAGLEPQPPCDQATWLRRVSLDLIGLPPTPAEVAAFVADRSDDACEREVDRLLASPAYGERQAQSWLDLARYADSQGYEKDDLRRSMWRYRDWVIDAFNRDLPFDRFTIEQLAGDLLPDPTIDQQVATAFHRQTMTNTEGGTDDEEFRTAALIDRVNTTMSVWMGSTLGCAQCHDHKFDPFTQREYYQLLAFFDQSEDADQPDERPTLPAPTPAEAARAVAVTAELIDLRRQLHGDDAAVQAWAARQRQRLQAFDAAAPEPTPWRQLGPFAAADFHTAFASAVLPALAEPSANWRERPDFTDGAVHTWSGDNSTFYLHRRIRAAAATPAVLSLGSDDGIKVWCNGELLASHEIGRAAAADQEVVDIELRQGDNDLVLAIVNGAGPSGFYFELRRTRLGAAAEAALLADAAADDPAIQTAHALEAPELEPVRRAIAARERELAALRGPAVPVMRELPPDRRRTTHVFLHGSFRTPGEVVTPDTPLCLPPLPADAPHNRLGLARWLVAPDNPLTARVQVNRLWEELFGRGLVATSEDFGSQGEPPRHPQLLDHLACAFRDGWSQKQLLRTIVLSATYRQQSVATPAQLERDPYNELLGRGPRFRLSAEQLRDQALCVSGLLATKLGGPSVMPPQPEGIWQQIYSGLRWQTSAGDDGHRRSLYTLWRRTSPHPTMTTFDAPSREYCVLRRVRTDTPLQALTTWNDPQFVECAQALAARVHGDPDAEHRIERMFTLCLLRPPTAAEAARLQQLFTAERTSFRTDVAAARDLAGSTAADTADIAELAALTVVANVLLNLDEFVTKP